MREIIATGKTVDEATENGCAELGLSRDQVSVEVLEVAVKKLFKTIPAKVRVTSNLEEDTAEEKPEAAPLKEARAQELPKEKNNAEKTEENKPKIRKETLLPKEPEVEIDLSANAQANYAAEYLTSIFEAAGVENVCVTATKQGDATLIRLDGDKLHDKIETKGETIQALSYLTDRVVNVGIDKKDGEYLRVRLDVAGYRSRRESELIALATRTANEVIKTKRSRTLAPMNPYERLIVHTAISEIEGVRSESTGSDTERRVVVRSLAPDATEGDDWRPQRKGNGGRDRRPSGGRRDNRGGRQGDNRRSSGGNRRPNDRYKDQPASSTPEREYVDKPRDPNAQPVMPERREAIRDGDDLPLYGKIEL